MSDKLNLVKNRYFPISPSIRNNLEREARVTDFSCIKEISSNKYSDIYLVSHKETKIEYALKVIKKYKYMINKEDEYFIHQEIENAYKVNHKNIVKILGHFEDNDNCYFILEYFPKGNIRNILPNNPNKRLSTKICSLIIRDVISAVYYLHNMKPKIILKNMTIENILLSDKYEAKLINNAWNEYMKDRFGLRYAITAKDVPMSLAPEIFEEKPYDESADLWSIGILLFQIVTKKDPFNDQDYDTFKYNVFQLKINWPKNVDSDAKDLIKKILKINPKERLPLEKMMIHPFITNFTLDAAKYLIKPVEGLKYEPFVLIKDDPKTWIPKEIK